MIIQKKHVFDGGIFWQDIPLPIVITDPLIFLNNHPDNQPGDVYRIIYKADHAESLQPPTPKSEVRLCKSP